jgi:hypothetical protein
MEMQNILVEKRNKVKTWATIIGIGIVGLVVAPFILMTIGGLIGLAIAAGISFTLVQLSPWFALKVANWKYRLIDAEKVEHIQKVTSAAEQNPIETLTALLLAKKVAYNSFKDSVTQSITARSTFKDKVDKFKVKYPARASEFESQLRRMTDLVERKKKALFEAQSSLEDGDNKLEEMKAYYEMSKAAIEANQAAGMDTGDAFEKLKSDTAVDAVFESMHAAFSQLEVAAALDVNSLDNPVQNATQLTYSESQVLEVPVTQLSQTQKVSR